MKPHQFSEPPLGQQLGQQYEGASSTHTYLFRYLAGSRPSGGLRVPDSMLVAQVPGAGPS